MNGIVHHRNCIHAYTMDDPAQVDQLSSGNIQRMLPYLLDNTLCATHTNRCFCLHLVPSWSYHFKVVIPLCTLPVPRRPSVFPYQTFGLLTYPIHTHRQTVLTPSSR